MNGLAVAALNATLIIVAFFYSHFVFIEILEPISIRMIFNELGFQIVRSCVILQIIFDFIYIYGPNPALQRTAIYLERLTSLTSLVFFLWSSFFFNGLCLRVFLLIIVQTPPPPPHLYKGGRGGG